MDSQQQRQRRAERVLSDERVGRPLGEQQLQIALLAGAGLTNIEIGDELGISPRTVRNALSVVYAKTNTTNRLELFKWLQERY